MLAITLKHPWPYAIRHWGKRIENRVWAPPVSQLHVGEEFALHGGVYPTARSLREARTALAHIRKLRGTDEPWRDPVEYLIQGIFAVARLDGLRHPYAEERPDDPLLRWHVPGQYGWILRPIWFLREPVPCKGAQKLWRVPPETLFQIQARMPPEPSP